MTPIEAVAVAFGLAAVWMTVKQNILCWPAGLVQVMLYIWIFYQVKLYSDLILHVVYVGVQIYGWYRWVKGGDDRNAFPVSRLTQRAVAGWSAATVIGTVGWGYLMASLTDAAVPYGDAFTTVASLIAMWLQAHKKIETWIFWILVDIAAIGIYAYKALWLTTGLYAVFLGMCVVGFRYWKRDLRAGEMAESV